MSPLVTPPDPRATDPLGVLPDDEREAWFVSSWSLETDRHYRKLSAYPQLWVEPPLTRPSGRARLLGWLRAR